MWSRPNRLLGLLQDLQDEAGVAYVFISHDMAVVEHMSHRIAIMKAGRIVEIGARDQVINEPTHEYTRTLLDAVPGRSWQPVTTIPPAASATPTT